MTAIKPSQPRKDDAPLSFEFEDGSPASAPAPSPAEAPAPSFNPFADQPVSLSLDAVPPAPVVPTEPAAGVDALKAAPGARPQPQPLAPVPVAPPAEEISPGRDLWHCPHCGAGNQPKRTTCRDCGKSPDEPVVVPFLRTPLGLGVVALAVAVVVFAGWRLTRTDKSFHRPGPAAVDTSARTWGMTDQDQEVGPNRLFNKRGEFSVSGRIIAAKAINGYDWITTLVLGLGPEVDSPAFSRLTATISDTDISSNAPHYLVLHCLFDGEVPELKPGAYVSLSGLRGNIQFEARLVPFIKLDQGHLAVKVERCEVAEGK